MTFPINPFILALNKCSQQKKRPYSWGYGEPKKNFYPFEFYPKDPNRESNFDDYVLVFNEYLPEKGGSGLIELRTDSNEYEEQIVEDFVDAFAAIEWDGFLITRSGFLFELEANQMIPLSEKTKQLKSWVPASMYSVGNQADQGKFYLTMEFTHDTHAYDIQYRISEGQIQIQQAESDPVLLTTKAEADQYFSRIQKKEAVCEWIHERLLAAAQNLDPGAFKIQDYIYVFHESIVSQLFYQGAEGRLCWKSHFSNSPAELFNTDILTQSGTEDEFEEEVLATFEKKVKGLRLKSVFKNGTNDGLFEAGVRAFGQARDYHKTYRGSVPLEEMSAFLKTYLRTNEMIKKSMPFTDLFIRDYYFKGKEQPQHVDTYEMGGYILLACFFSGKGILCGEMVEQYYGIIEARDHILFSD